MVILDVQLWELATQRLHQGMSETILVNTLTDVRELKKKSRKIWEKDFFLNSQFFKKISGNFVSVFHLILFLSTL